MANERALELDSSVQAGRVRTHTAGADLRPLLTIQQVAAYLNISHSTVRRLVARRQMPCVRVGGQLRFSAGELQRWLGRNNA